MTTRASQNGTGTAEMEFEDEWEAPPGGHPYSSGPSPYSNVGEFEDEWETPPAHYSHNPFVQGEFEGEWEAGTPQHFSGPSAYSSPVGEFEDEWEAHPGSHPYSSGPSAYSSGSQNEFEDEWEAGTPQHYSGPEREFEDEWEAVPGSHHYSSGPSAYSSGSQNEFEDEWEAAPGSHPYNHPEMGRADHFIPLIAKAASKLIPHAVRLGRSLFRGRGSQQSRASAPAVGQSQQIAALFHRLGRLFAQGESYAINQEAEMFGVNEFETEVAGHPAAHLAALTEFLAAEAAHTQNESEAEALASAALPMSIRVMGGRIGLQRLTPALVRVNASLVLNLHRQGTPGRQLIRVVPTIQRHTLATIRAIQNTGRPVTPALASQIMAGHARRILTTPHICRPALVRNMMIRNNTVARSGARVGQRVGA